VQPTGIWLLQEGYDQNNQATVIAGADIPSTTGANNGRPGQPSQNVRIRDDKAGRAEEGLDDGAADGSDVVAVPHKGGESEKDGEFGEHV
jgi:hypothetical protein